MLVPPFFSFFCSFTSLCFFLVFRLIHVFTWAFLIFLWLGWGLSGSSRRACNVELYLSLFYPCKSSTNFHTVHNFVLFCFLSGSLFYFTAIMSQFSLFFFHYLIIWCSCSYTCLLFRGILVLWMMFVGKASITKNALCDFLIVYTWSPYHFHCRMWFALLSICISLLLSLSYLD